MPFRTYKYVLIEADTRCLEMFLSIAFGFGWCFYILFTRGIADQTSGAWLAINSMGGWLPWAVWAGMNGATQFFSIWYQYPKWRFATACSSSIYWIWVFFVAFALKATIIFPWMAFVVACGELWIVLHRASVDGGKT